MSGSVRIVAGEFRGRQLAAPIGVDTRPTANRVREALFSSLVSIAGPSLGAREGLDAFAGSGALGLEALSRGLAHVTFIERDTTALTALRNNIAALGIQERTTVVAGDALAVFRSDSSSSGPFSLLLLDPPYRLAGGEIARFLSTFVERRLLEDGALIAYEHASRECVTWPAGVTLRVHKKYGSTEVEIAQYEREARSQ